MGAAAGVARPQPGQLPAQGGKGGAKPYTPIGAQPQVPAQGKGQNLGPNVFPAPQVQQPQVPAQGGKMSPLINQLQQSQVPAQGGEARVPMGGFMGGPGQPQVQQQMQMMTPQELQNYKQYGDAYYGQPQRTLTPAEMATSGLSQPLVQQRDPRVMPARPMPNFGNTGGSLVKPSPFPQQPQVLPARPMPANMAPQGLMGLQQTLAGQRLAPGQSAPAPGLNGVPGNQNPLYFGPGRR